MVITEIADKDFNSEVLQSDIIVFACFTAAWCSSCFPTCISAKSLAEEYCQRIKFVRCDAEKCAATVKKYNIGVFPTIMLFQSSGMVKKLVGYKEKHSLRRVLDGYLTVSSVECKANY